MSSRGRRRVSKDNYSDALEEFEQFKKGSKKRKLTPKKSLIEEIKEDEYEKLVKRRREDDFIEDDDLKDYIDDGEEWWGNDEEITSKKPRRTRNVRSGIFNAPQSTAPKKASQGSGKEKPARKNLISAALKRSSAGSTDHFDRDHIEIDKMLNEFADGGEGASALDLLTDLTKQFGPNGQPAPLGGGLSNDGDAQLEFGGEESTVGGYGEEISDDLISMKETALQEEVPLPVSAVQLEEFIDPQTAKVKFFWFDVSEQRDSGLLNIIGKVKRPGSPDFASATLTVLNVERRVYFIPRNFRFDVGNQQMTSEEVSLQDVSREIQQLFRRLGILRFKMRVVKRKCWNDGQFEGSVFNDMETDVTKEISCVEVLYSGNEQQLSQKLYAETFSRVFNTTMTKTEQFLLDKNLSGPCWLDIENPKAASHLNSWTALQFQVHALSFVNPSEEQFAPPPMGMMCLHVDTILNMEKRVKEILMLSYIIFDAIDLGNPKFEATRFVSILRPPKHGIPTDFERLCGGTSLRGNVHVVDSERGLLNLLLAAVKKHDPDVICGHELFGMTLNTLLQRMKDHKLEAWSKLGRIRRATIPNLNKAYEMGVSELMRGRIVVDTFLGARENLRCNSYKLAALASDVLGRKYREYSTPETVDMLRSSESLISFVVNSREGCALVVELLKRIQLLNLSLQLTKLVGNLWSRTLAGGRNERNEMLLMHRFHNLGYLLPERMRIVKSDQDGASGGRAKRQKPQYEGGLVLEPLVGFYSKMILLLDFNSLYPSIIQENNICFTTVSMLDTQGDSEQPRPMEDGEGVAGDIGELYGRPMPTLVGKSKGVLPTVVEELVGRRREVKRLMNSPNLAPEEKEQHNIRQMALKLTANSLYGCLGFTFSRFYAKELARLITARGREALIVAKNMATDLGHEVVYGDTDSIMINTKTNSIKEVLEIAKRLKNAINEKYRKLEIDVDGIFAKLLLLKKKKYAAVLLERHVIPHTKDERWVAKKKMEIKGIDMVRRDWCDISKEISEGVLNIFFKRDSEDRSGDGDAQANAEEEVEQVDIMEEVALNIHEYLRNKNDCIRRGEIEYEKFQIRKVLMRDPSEYADMKNQPHVVVAARLMEQKKAMRVGNVVSYIVCAGASTIVSERCFTLEELRNNTNLRIDTKWYIENQILPPVQRICEPLDETVFYRRRENTILLAECFGIQSSSKARRQAEDEEMKNAEYRYPCSVRCGSNHESVVEKNEEGKWVLACSTCKQKFDDTRMNRTLKYTVKRMCNEFHQGYYKCNLCGDKTRYLGFSDDGDLCKRAGCDGTYEREFSCEELYDHLLHFRDIVNESGLEMSRDFINMYLLNSAFSSVNLGNFFRGVHDIELVD